MSECIGRQVARDLDQVAPYVDPRSVFGLFDSGGSKIAEGKQAMISESIVKQLSAKGQ